jgi:phosphogluconate dehydratase
LRLLSGNLGRAVIKVSAVKPQHRIVEAPAIVFDSQEAFMRAYKAGELDRDFIAVVRYQGPRANGMPELHALTPALGSLQDAGRHVALVTDGRMSGASGKVPAAIHVSPEVLAGGPLGRVRSGDMIRLDAEAGVLQALVPQAEWVARTIAVGDLSANQVGMGRELFAMFRKSVSAAEEGATTFGLPPPLHMPEENDNQLAVPEDQSSSDEDTLIRNN